MTDQHADIENRFSYHPAATPERQAQHEAVRDACKKLAHALDRIVPAGRHKSLALTAVEEAMHWANAGVACQPAPKPEPPAARYSTTGGDAFSSNALNGEIPIGRTWRENVYFPNTVHDVPEDQLDDHLTFDAKGMTCICEPTVEPYRGGLRHVHNAFPTFD